MTATELARNLSSVLSRLESGTEEIAIVRNRHVVGRLVPGAPTMTAREAFADLPGAIFDKGGAAWLRDCRGVDRRLRKALADPWA